MNKGLLAIIFILIATGAASADFMEAVKKTNANLIEDALPEVKFEDWIHSKFKFGTSVTWEINDCGEGSDTKNSRAPTCVEAQIPSKDGYTLHINTIIGVTTELEVTSRQLWMVYFYKSDGYKTLDVVRVSSISEALIEYHKRNNE